MNIYIDESGIFANPAGKNIAISCVGSLVMPERLRCQIVKGYGRLLKKWGFKTNQEVKGSDFDETMFVELIKMLSKFDVMFSAVAIDMGYQIAEDVSCHKEAQADNIIKNLSGEFYNSFLEEAFELCCNLKKIPNQLYLQSICMNMLVSNTLRNATLYYSKTSPEALGRFSWNIDAKSNSITNYEKLWSIVVGGVLQSESLRSPFIQLDGGNYNAFKRFENETTTIPAHLEAAFDGDPDKFMSCDLGKMLKEDMQFKDSKSDKCLQIVDVLTNCLGRSLRGNFQRSGWSALPEVMYSLIGKGGAIPFATISAVPNGQRSYFECVDYLDRNAAKLYMDERPVP
ncbi:DUF3800 domain-containing protein [Maridesulfovibrio sp.]|uniref:DUF3800 domain-containing protein n=1 Tax=Maridesulfovibrio sp. TaxID=2795000 RepID=UPI0039EF7EF7